MSSPSASPRRSLRPTRRVGCAFAVVAFLLLGSCSGDSSDSNPTTTTEAADDTVDLFDASVVHDISVEFDQTEYDAMIDAFADTGDKGWIEATLTIDGVTYERAGLRLKGNSSLMGLSARQADDEVAASTTTAPSEETTEPADAAPGGGFPGPVGGADADVPEKLPWLIRLDEFVQDQRHQGYADIVVRSNVSTTSLNEAVALDLLDATVLASQQAISTSFTVNGGNPVLRLAIEHPDDDAWQEQAFPSAGALYKAESTGDWSYRGDDPEAYAEAFDQEGGKKVADLTPLIEFLQFINDSDDETFASELPARLDVDAFATYLALMDLMENFDDIDGPGNNAYLWWDEETEQFTLVPWDMNFTFGVFGGVPDRGALPEGFDPGNLPEGFEAPGGGGRRFGGNNILVTRFHENPEFEALYQERLLYFRADLFRTSTADSLLDARVQTLETVPDLVDKATLNEEADALRGRFEQTAAAGL